ncbi:MAG: hypothetical protein IPH37_11765 [Burkholderiales bacterium]|nr:hypothetical protein [Burkholderiales bacterium]
MPRKPVETPSIIRQGDVLLVPISAIPPGCTDVALEGGRIVLMHGEVTGHAHAIADHIDRICRTASANATTDTDTGNTAQWQDAARMASNAITQARHRARLLESPDGQRYLEVTAPVTLRHEEHTAHRIPAGLYALPVQMENTAQRMRQVRD